MNSAEKETAQAIGQFYVESQDSNLDYSQKVTKAHRELDVLNIKSLTCGVDYKGTWVVTIDLSRPGVLIGVKGSNINALTEYLSARFKTSIKIKIKESHLDTFLYPVDYNEYFIEEQFSYEDEYSEV